MTRQKKQTYVPKKEKTPKKQTKEQKTLAKIQEYNSSKIILDEDYYINLFISSRDQN